MRRFLRWLGGSDEATREPNRETRDSKTQGSRTGKAKTDEYYKLLGLLQESLAKRDFQNAAEIALRSLDLIPSLVRESKREYGSFDLSSIPALERGGTALALQGDLDGLQRMLQAVQSSQELREWKPVLEGHIEDLTTFTSILEAIEENPGCRQQEVKKLINVGDGRRVASLISWLEKAGKISCRKRGKEKLLFIAGSQSAKPLPPREVASTHRKGKASKRCLEIKIEGLPYIPLPRAPARWEAQTGKPDGETKAADWFELLDAPDWVISSVEKVPPDERPDGAFRQIHLTDAGLFMVDDLGNSEVSGEAPAALQSYSRNGSLLAEAPVSHSIYRTGVNALGSSLIAMSKQCVVHAYDANLNPILETSLSESPEVVNLIQRLGADRSRLHTHLRSVAISHDRSRYLFSAVDEAWCLSIEGECLWGARLPLQEGWQRYGEPSSRYGTDSEVTKALSVMGLELPFSPEDFKSRYRQLVKQWHPDVNRSASDALRRMQEINVAAELLSGIDQSNVASYAGASYARQVQSVDTRVGSQSVTIEVGLAMSEISAADWVYASSLGGASHSAYLAGYSGRIIQVDESGLPVRAYDIGAVPRRIVDTGDYLYFLTDTRLYILKEDMLVGVVDTSSGGNLVVAQTSFGLLEKKRLRWFQEDGTFLGAVLTKNPIRRVYHSPAGMVIETRQRKCLMEGASTWWE